ncbi:probable receptor-like protein kinase At1g11050 [Typha angustifolia]|uniref:probable receptor-like protein kinase At1g11050 n=1 Tax=Typha angustifolia TaxID=59011 RepID=UPI003C2BFECE
MATSHATLSLVLLFLLLPLTSAATNSTCPMDLSYVSTFPWDHSSCLPTSASSNLTGCCSTLLSLFGIALATRLRTTSLFRLPDNATSVSCLSSFQSRLSSPPLSLSTSLVSSCFPYPSNFVISPKYCAGIQTKKDWIAKLGNDTSLDSACNAEFSDLTRCGTCLTAGFDVSSRLTALDGNSSHATPCFYLTVLYAAGVINRFGPEYPPTAGCILGLALSTSSSPTQSSSHHPSAAVVASSVSAAALFLSAVALLALFLRRKQKRRKKDSLQQQQQSSSSRSHPRPNTGSILFDIKELDKATGYFSQRNLIGRGGFGAVYKGVLADGSVVAVKKMLELDLDGGDEEFRNEVEIISSLRHRNLVPLRGCCIPDDDVEEGKQRFLVYDYMPNGNLEQHIFRSERNSNRPPLSWPQRKNIILDVGKGLMYLHYGVKPAIYHRDIKATNILLDGEMRARVADFGLARESKEGQSHLTTRVAGTHGYLAPEYALYCQLTEKSDVYSFGILVLETMSGRKALDMAAPSNMVLITDWAWTLIKAGRAAEVLDEVLMAGDAQNPKGIMERFVLVGILCAHVMVALRPTIAEAVRMLEGDVDLPAIPDRPMPLGHGFGFGDGANTFSASPRLSGPCLDTGDMLR